jgi:hypothetical protein
VESQNSPIVVGLFALGDNSAMFLQIVGSTPPVPWYERSSLWGIVGVFLCLYFAGIGVGMTLQLPERICLFAALPCGVIAAWLAINGLTTRRAIRIMGRIVTTILIGMMLWGTDLALAKRREHNNTTWRLDSCSVVKDDRVQEGQSVRLVLRGPTVVEATEWENHCRIPVGTEFQRNGGFVCNSSAAGSTDVGCFGVESEKALSGGKP